MRGRWRLTRWILRQPASTTSENANTYRQQDYLTDNQKCDHSALRLFAVILRPQKSCRFALLKHISRTKPIIHDCWDLILIKINSHTDSYCIVTRNYHDNLPK